MSKPVPQIFIGRPTTVDDLAHMTGSDDVGAAILRADYASADPHPVARSVDDELAEGFAKLLGK